MSGLTRIDHLDDFYFLFVELRCTAVLYPNAHYKRYMSTFVLEVEVLLVPSDVWQWAVLPHYGTVLHGSPSSDSCQVRLRHVCAMFSAVRVALEERAFVYALVALTCFAVRRTMENTLV